MLLRLRTRRWKLWFESSYLIQNSKFQIDKPTDVLYIHDLHVNQLFLYLINVSCVFLSSAARVTWAKFQQGFGCFGEARPGTHRPDTRDTWAGKDIHISEKR